jgi:sporadic carbohydrate cluster protein (TIGR04323 family)
MVLRGKMDFRKEGYRGYIGSRPYEGSRVPQHVQNLVIRDFCSRNNFKFLLSMTEHTMPNCFMQMNSLVEEAPRLEGIILYSIFMLPVDSQKRRNLCEKILRANCTIHGAVENISISNWKDFEKNETLLKINKLIHFPDINQLEKDIYD